MKQRLVGLAVAGLAMLWPVVTAYAEPLPFRATVRVDIGALDPIGYVGAGTLERTTGANGSVSIAIPAGALATQQLRRRIPATQSLAPLSGIQVTASNAPGVLARQDANDRYAGTLPLGGVTKVCLFGYCDAAPLANLSLPNGVIGLGGVAAATGAVHLTVIGAPWTTGPVEAPATTFGPGAVSGAHATGAGTLTMQVVTPLRIESDLPAIGVVLANGFIAFEAGSGCSDAIDNDGDGDVDFPVDEGCVDANDPSERIPLTACQDGVDNDGDGLVDAGEDPGCQSNPRDRSERQGYFACDDGVDNDRDRAIDFPADLGCADPLDGWERGAQAACDDGADDDGDGVADFPNDPECDGPLDTSETEPFCENGLDDDDDGLADAFDPGCADADDESERDPAVACDDGLDDDGDGRVDGGDLGCTGPSDPSERGTAPCDDEIDNDADGASDFRQAGGVATGDLGCTGPDDPSEAFACADGADNDGDGLVDHPDDLGCASADDDLEHVQTGGATPPCDNGRDDDGDRKTDLADPGCAGPADPSERGTAGCDDGSDDDGDGLTDFPNDPGCGAPGDASERDAAIACDDGIDGDGDGATDFPADPSCGSSGFGSEQSAAFACDDGVDQDGDTLVDFPADPDCVASTDAIEGPDGAACGNGVDDDGDGAADGADPACDGATDLEEAVLFAAGGTQTLLASASLVAESVRVADGLTPTELTLDDSDVGHRTAVAGGSSLVLRGGSTIGGDVEARDDARVDVTDGVVGGVLRSFDRSRVTIARSSAPLVIEARGESRVSIAGLGPPPSGWGALAALGGTLAGTFSDGTPLSLVFARAPTATIELVPEPEVGLLGAAAIASLARLRRKPH